MEFSQIFHSLRLYEVLEEKCQMMLLMIYPFLKTISLQ